MTIAGNTLADEKLTRFKVEMANAAKGHATALAGAQAALEEIIEAMFEPADVATSKSAILDALQTRSQPDWMSTHLGVIA